MAVLVDRETELQVLETEYRRPGFSFVVVYGRRRVGKTYLIRWFCRGKPCIYYVAAELPYEVLSREFSELASSFLGLPVAGDVVKVLEALCRLWRGKEKLVVVFDEFQYMVESDESLPSRLMRSIDLTLSNCNMMLVVCGSAVSFFEKKLLGYRAPLYGRRTAELKLRPLSLWGVWSFNPELDLVEASKLYGVAGGTPAYLSQLKQPTPEGFIRLATSPGSPLYEEPVWLLRQELREPRTYMAILRAVAEGKVEPSQAAQVAGVDPRSVTRYIEVLEELEIVARVRPLGRRRPVQLRFVDNFFRFWFTFIQPMRSHIEAGGYEKTVEAILSRIDQYMGRVFEETITPQLVHKLVEHGIPPLNPVETGPWWKADIDIDYVVREPGKATLFVEAKWSRLDTATARRILSKLEDKARETGLQAARNYYLVIARELEKPILEENHIAIDLAWLTHKGIAKPAARREQ